MHLRFRHQSSLLNLLSMRHHLKPEIKQDLRYLLVGLIVLTRFCSLRFQLPFSVVQMPWQNPKEAGCQQDRDINASEPAFEAQYAG